MSNAESAPEQSQVRSLLRLALLGALVGLPTGLVSFAFISIVHLLEVWMWDDLPLLLGSHTPPWYLVVGLPVIGGVLVHLARMLPGDGGASPLATSHAPHATPGQWGVLSVILAALATLSFGLVLGPEAPLIALGIIVATWLTSWVRMPQLDRTMVGMSGSAAAMSTLFGGPLVAGLMILEAAAGTPVSIVAVVIPALMSASVAYLLITGMGMMSGLPMQGLAVPDLPTYDSVRPIDLVIAVIIGGLGALTAAMVRLYAGKLAAQEKRIGRLPLLMGGGLAVGLVALAARALGANSQDVLFSGQAAMSPLIAQTSAGAVAVLLVAKALAYLISLGAGFRGGAIFPAIFLGVAFAQFGVIWTGMSPTVAVAMGTAAGMAAMTRTLLAPVLFATILTAEAGHDAVPVAAIAGVAAWLASSWLDSRATAKQSADAS
ncbi:MAG TPA: chloride channel protein [Micropruina sp.]|nr:chloride channel protein [Micropruina sp.]